MIDVIGRRYAVSAEPLVRDVSDVVAEHGDWAAGPAIDQQISGDKAASALGWQPKHTDILSVIR